MQDINVIRLELFSSNMQGTFPLLHQPALGAVLDICQFDPAVTDSTAACITALLLHGDLGLAARHRGGRADR